MGMDRENKWLRAVLDEAGAVPDSQVVDSTVKQSPSKHGFWRMFKKIHCGPCGIFGGTWLGFFTAAVVTNSDLCGYIALGCMFIYFGLLAKRFGRCPKWNK